MPEAANAILRFDPKTERFEPFPLPESYASVRVLLSPVFVVFLVWFISWSVYWRFGHAGRWRLQSRRGKAHLVGFPARKLVYFCQTQS